MKQPWDDEAKRFLATQLPIVVRRSGLGAEARVKSIFAKKGVDGVFDEIDLLGGDYARRLYLSRSSTSRASMRRRCSRCCSAPERMITSDYDRRQVLEHVASRVHARSERSLGLRAGDGDDEVGLRPARGADRADQRSGRRRWTATRWRRRLTHMKSSYDKRMVLEDMLARGHDERGGEEDRPRRGRRRCQSDYDRRQVLTAYVTRFGVEPALREPFFAAVRDDQVELRPPRVLTGLAKKGSSPREVQDAVFDSVGQMTSDYDRAEVLLAFAPRRRCGAAGRRSSSAAERIKSSYDQNRVLAALVKAERR